MSELYLVTPEQIDALNDRIKDLEEKLSYSQRLPELDWAEVKSSLMQRLAILARNGNPEEAQRLMSVIDRGSTYVSRLREQRDKAIAELEEYKKGSKID